jgi:hypothetical protein
MMYEFVGDESPIFPHTVYGPSRVKGDVCTTKAMRANDGKTMWDLLPYEQLEEAVKVLEYGAKKYAAWNWQKPMPLNEIWACAMRHMVELSKKNMLDEETKCHHAGHVIANMLFYIYHSQSLTNGEKEAENAGGAPDA